MNLPVTNSDICSFFIIPRPLYAYNPKFYAPDFTAAGVLILIVPRRLHYIVAGYLIFIGLAGLSGGYL